MTSDRLHSLFALVSDVAIVIVTIALVAASGVVLVSLLP
jgi:hypothetical protein